MGRPAYAVSREFRRPISFTTIPAHSSSLTARCSSPAWSRLAFISTPPVWVPIRQWHRVTTSIWHGSYVRRWESADRLWRTFDSTAIPTNTAEVIDLTAASPSWRNVGPMEFARRYLYGTILADGKVLISGGLSNSPPEDCTAPVLPAEIWDPAAEAFTTVAGMPHYRGYHSTAVLLPDGRVLSAGTTSNGTVCADQKDADFYSPPYLFNGPRPSITSAPTSLSYGQLFTVNPLDAANIANVNLIALSAVTHHFNFNQCIVRATFTKGTNLLTITALSGPNLSPPGEYMMFMLNGSGVPSVASIIQVGVATPTVSITALANVATVSGTVSIATKVTSSVSSINVILTGIISPPPRPITSLGIRPRCRTVLIKFRLGRLAAAELKSVQPP